jgi:hypothetical protein
MKRSPHSTGGTTLGELYRTTCCSILSNAASCRLHRSNQCYGATVKSSRGDAIVQGRKVDATSIDATLPSHFCRRITSIVRLMGWCWPLRCEIAGQWHGPSPNGATPPNTRLTSSWNLEHLRLGYGSGSKHLTVFISTC